MSKKKVYIIAVVAILVALVAEIGFAHPHVYSWWHALPGFDILFGFFGCALLIVVAKVILAPIIQKREDFYDDGGEDDRD